MSKVIGRKKLRNGLRYIAMFFAFFILSQYTPECQVSVQTSLTMGFIGAVAFVLIDIYFPLVAVE